MSRYVIVYQREIHDVFEAVSINAAAAAAQHAVLSLPPEYGAKVLSITEVKDPAIPAPQAA